MKKPLPEFVRFCIVGGFLFVIDATLVEIIVHQGISPFVARLISLSIGMQIAYVAHGIFTFRNHIGFNKRSWLSFQSTNIMGACINYGVFTIVLSLMGEEHGMISRVSAIVVGTGVALFFNYGMNRYFVFKRKA